MSNAAPIALRRLPRPPVVLACAVCGAPAGASYPACSACFDTLERHWVADWDALLQDEDIAQGTEDEIVLARIVLEEVERHAWSCVNVAMTLVTCAVCGAELGGGPSTCNACAAAFGAVLWSEALAGRRGAVSGNEHALHMGRFLLRHPHRFPAHLVAGMRQMLPRLLTGWMPSVAENQRMVALQKSGRFDELRAAWRAIDRRIAAQAGRIDSAL